MRRILVSSTHPVKSLHGNTQAEWKLMSQEEQLQAWLKSCPFDYLEVGKIKGIRTINFEIKEDAVTNEDV